MAVTVDPEAMEAQLDMAEDIAAVSPGHLVPLETPGGQERLDSLDEMAR